MKSLDKQIEELKETHRNYVFVTYCLSLGLATILVAAILLYAYGITSNALLITIGPFTSLIIFRRLNNAINENVAYKETIRLAQEHPELFEGGEE